MTTPASPTPRSAPMRRPSPRSGSSNALSSGSQSTASLSRGCCPTTGRPTRRSLGVMPARGSVPHTSGRVRIGRRRTGRSNASTAPPRMVGRMRGSTRQRPSGVRHYRAGCTSTIITGTTPQSAPHPSAGSTTSLDITPRSPRRRRWRRVPTQSRTREIRQPSISRSTI